MKAPRVAACILAAAATHPGARAEGMIGFKAASAAAELGRERAFDAALDPAEMRSWLERMSSAPNHVGSPHDKENAEFILAKFREWGWDARIESFDVLYPTPKSESLELVSPEPYRARLAEGAVEGDRTSALAAQGLPPFNVYGADGDVTGELVYVNFGMPDDYAELGRRGIDVRGRIVIARYGGGWRGLKAKLAQERGALGCVIYSDPHEGGYWEGDVYPKGAYRGEWGVQRGSVADLTLYSGDPLTPGYPATPDARRLPIAEAKSVLKIPVIPISSGDARPFLAALGGPVAPASWRGALPLTYHLGPGPARAHLAVACDWGLKPVYDVVAFLAGSSLPNQWVIRGNHHDGWVFGTWDPLSGTTALMAEAKALGALAKAGWRPRRTLVYASWDGEEAGLLGSAEWAELHADELRRKAVLYVNSDTDGRGFLFAGGSHAYQHLMNQVAAAVSDPETGASVAERLRAKLRVGGPPRSSSAELEAQFAAAEGGAEVPLGALGSGSDYSPFLQHLGVSSINLGYGGEDQDDGIYHSAYDSFDHFIRFGDPKFAYVPLLAQTAGRLVLRTAEADVIPERFSDLAAAVARYVADVEKVLDAERRDAAKLAKLVSAGDFRLADNPDDGLQAPPMPAPVPQLDLGPLRVAAGHLRRSAAAYDAAFARLADTDYRLPPGELRELNDALQAFEQSLLARGGLPGREWYEHMLYAPGAFTGYAVKTLPAVREPIEEQRWGDAQANIPLVAAAIEAAAVRIEGAARQLQPRLGPGPALPKVPRNAPPPPDS